MYVCVYIWYINHVLLKQWRQCSLFSALSKLIHLFIFHLCTSSLFPLACKNYHENCSWVRRFWQYRSIFSYAINDTALIGAERKSSTDPPRNKYLYPCSCKYMKIKQNVVEIRWKNGEICDDFTLVMTLKQWNTFLYWSGVVAVIILVLITSNGMPGNHDSIPAHAPAIAVRRFSTESSL